MNINLDVHSPAAKQAKAMRQPLRPRRTTA